MRQRVGFVFVVIACLCVPARPAEAQGGFLEWLERLSGPGPFKGGGVHIHFLCYGFKKPDGSEAPDPINPSEYSDKRSPFAHYSCGPSARNVVRVAIGAQASWLSGDNTLLYDPSVPAAEIDKVKASMYLGTVDVGVHRSLDVGFGAGFVRFSDLPVDAFTRFAVQPVRIVLKPLAMFASGQDTYRREWLQLRFVASMFPQGFDAEDFGAIPGTFESSKEIQGSFAIVINFFAAIKK